MRARLLVSLLVASALGCSADSFSGSDAGAGDGGAAEASSSDAAADGGAVDGGPGVDAAGGDAAPARPLQCGDGLACTKPEDVCCGANGWSPTSCTTKAGEDTCAAYVECTDSRDCPTPNDVCCATLDVQGSVKSAACTAPTNCLTPKLRLCGNTHDGKYATDCTTGSCNPNGSQPDWLYECTAL